MSKHSKKPYLLERIIRIVILVACGAFIGFSICIFNARVVLHDPYPTIGGFGFSVVVSGSMEPTIKIDDVIITEEQNSYDVDDIITYIDENGQSMVIHRVVDINNDGQYICQGDANNTTDRPVDPRRVRGKMIGVILGAGWIFTPTFVYILGAIIVVLLILSLLGEAKQRKQDRLRQEKLREEINRLKIQ